MSTAAPPWGTTRMGPFVEPGSVPALTSAIDPETQVAVYYDDQGRELEMGAHGTSTNTSTPTTTGGGGGDGQGGGQSQPTDIDSMPANDQDQGTG